MRLLHTVFPLPPIIVLHTMDVDAHQGFYQVYELIGQRWTDRGTALCTGIYDEEVDQAAIVARSEISDVELLRSEIRVNDVYQRQQGWFYRWSDDQ